jgi:TonB family protein
MGYQALLFCPDEKTARTVTQVLSELEFNVETCSEPFAAVKKLMSQHFDAVVVDCDNEQNATLLFKSARNSTSNQASLAVAVVEGQAGVAKAFRIGANLVLTKPINIEQAKGTLRVARGLLRKSEPAKPGVAATASSAGIPVNAPAKQKTQAVPLAVSTASAQTKSDTHPVTRAPFAAKISNAGASDEDLLDIGEGDTVAAPSEVPPVAPAFRGFITPAPQAEKFLAAAVVSAAPEGKSASIPVSLAHGRGAASAPAPAREREDARVLEAPAQRSVEADSPSKKAEVAQSESSSLVRSARAFSFGGNNATAESSGGGKKVLVAAAAALIVAAVAYAGWARFHGRSSEPDTTPTEDTPTTVVSPQATRPSGAKPSAASTAKPSSTLSVSLPNSNSQAALNEKGHGSDSDSAFDDSDTSAASSTKTSASASSASSTTADTDEAPLVIKAGKAPGVHAKSGAADAPAPSMIGIATAGAGAPPPNFGSGGEIVPKPLLQTLNISQGVSHGLLIKKVQPVYPRNALAMRVEGSIELLATISKTGDITQVKVLSGDSQLTKAATDAVKQWKYKPYLLNGEPVEIQTQVTINFKLPK